MIFKSILIFCAIFSAANIYAVLPNSITQREYNKFEEVSGQTAVRVTGTVSTTTPTPSPTAVDKVSVATMYDDNGEFLRFFYLNYLGAVLSSSDKELDGVTAYTASGIVHAYPNVIGFN